MIDRERAEKIIGQQDIKELAAIAHRHSGSTKDGGLPEYGAAVLNLRNGQVYGTQEWPEFHKEGEEDDGEGMGHEVLLVAAHSGYHSPRLTKEQFVEEQVREGLDWGHIRGHLDDMYGRQ